MATRIPPFTSYQTSVHIPEEASLSKQQKAAPPTSNAWDEQAEFEQLEKIYYETIARTNSYPDGGRADLENSTAYDRLVDFAEKHPELRCILPMNPIGDTHSHGDDGCSVS